MAQVLQFPSQRAPQALRASDRPSLSQYDTPMSGFGEVLFTGLCWGVFCLTVIFAFMVAL